MHVPVGLVNAGSSKGCSPRRAGSRSKWVTSSTRAGVAVTGNGREMRVLGHGAEIRPQIAPAVPRIQASPGFGNAMWRLRRMCTCWRRPDPASGRMHRP